MFIYIGSSRDKTVSYKTYCIFSVIGIKKIYFINLYSFFTHPFYCEDIGYVFALVLFLLYLSQSSFRANFILFQIMTNKHIRINTNKQLKIKFN